jgi:periodic tryptophan protein 1
LYVCRYHKEKVQSLAWHPSDPHTLATGCCDQRVRAADCRSQESHKAWRVGGEVERVIWDQFNPFHCLASTDAGTVHCIDVRWGSFLPLFAN